MKNSNYLHKIKSFFIIIATVMIIACNAGTRPVEKLAKEVIATEDTTLKWIDYRIGELPPMGYYDGLDSVVRKWKLRYQRVDGGCEVIDGEKEKYEKDNYKYFAILEQKYGTNWRKRFETEVAAFDNAYQQ